MDLLITILRFVAWGSIAATFLVLMAGMVNMVILKNRDPVAYAVTVNKLFVRRVAFQFLAILAIAILLLLG